MDGIHIIYSEEPLQDGLIHLKGRVLHLQKGIAADQTRLIAPLLIFNADMAV